MKRKGCGPRALGSPFKQLAKAENIYSRPSRTVEEANKSSKKSMKEINKGTSEEDTFTPTYNAATGMTIDQDPSYKYERRESYKKNAIDKYGSLSNARNFYKSRN